MHKANWRNTFEEIMSFLKMKIGFVQNEKDLKEIDEFLKNLVGKKISQEQMSYIMMKILPFEIKKSRLEDDIQGYNFELQ